MRTIHLNPLRSGLVADLAGLDGYAYSGHSALVGRVERGWQATGTVLALFGRKRREARSRYRKFLEEGIGEGQRDDLTGGGLTRSLGGWRQVRALRRGKVFHKSDERILGDSDFVEDVLAAANERMTRRARLRADGVGWQALMAAVAGLTGLGPDDIVSRSREPKKVAARSLLCFWASAELRMTLAELSRRLPLSPFAVSLAVARGEQLSRANGWRLAEILKLEN